MRRIWRFFDGLTTIKETLIFQGALLEFHITAMRPIWIHPQIDFRKSKILTTWAEGA